MGRILTETELNSIPFRKFSSFMVTVTAILGSFNFGYQIASLNTSTNLIIQYFKMCDDDRTYTCDKATDYFRFITPIIFLGGMFGAYFAGMVLHKGRIFVFHFANITFIIGPLIVALSFGENAMLPMFLIGRFVSGLGLGAVTTVAPIYIAEYSPLSRRGLHGAFHQTTLNLGIFSAIVLGLPQTQPATDDIQPPSEFNGWYWRLLVCYGSFVAIVQSSLLIFVHKYEPASFIVSNCQFIEELNKSNKKMQKAKMSLCVTYVDSVADQVLDSLIAQREVILSSPMKPITLGVPAIIKNKLHLYVLGIGTMMALMQQISCINVIVTKSNALLADSGVASNIVTIISVCVSLANVLSSSFSSFFVDRHGRKKILIIGLIGQSISMAPASIVYWFESNIDINTMSTLATISMIGYSFFFAFALGPVVWIYVAEIFTPETVNASFGVVGTLNWLATLIIVFVSGYVSTAIIYNISFWSGLLSILFIIFVLLETSGKKQSPYYESTNPIILDEMGMRNNSNPEFTGMNSIERTLSNNLNIEKRDEVSSENDF